MKRDVFSLFHLAITSLHFFYLTHKTISGTCLRVSQSLTVVSYDPEISSNSLLGDHATEDTQPWCDVSVCFTIDPSERTEFTVYKIKMEDCDTKRNGLISNIFWREESSNALVSYKPLKLELGTGSFTWLTFQSLESLLFLTLFTNNYYYIKVHYKENKNICKTNYKSREKKMCAVTKVELVTAKDKLISINMYRNRVYQVKYR